MKRVYLLAAIVPVAFSGLAAQACHRDNCPGTTNTTAATVTPPPAEPQLTSAELSGAPSTDATAGPAAGTTATATPAAKAPAPPATGTAPIDISGPSPAAQATTAATAAVAPAPAGNANATSTITTPAAPLVSPGLDNTVSGGVANTGAPFNYASPYDNTVYGSGGPAPMAPANRPIGGPMRPGAASNPDTTSGAH